MPRQTLLGHVTVAVSAFSLGLYSTLVGWQRRNQIGSKANKLAVREVDWQRGRHMYPYHQNPPCTDAQSAYGNNSKM
ncbi:hypothetical protein F5884DRAFT_769676 [Xylogone sp. PMI_703]|nr:hypothetical protein F5884DRAFT_769676 [Xylogone sp. PMI_703]